MARIVSRGRKAVTQGEPGTVIHGTMRAQDLMDAFLQALGDLDESEANKLRGSIPEEAVGNEDDEFWKSGAAEDLLAELFDALDYHSPDGYYFGAHPGDGSDYGWWPYEDDEEADMVAARKSALRSKGLLPRAAAAAFQRRVEASFRLLSSARKRTGMRGSAPLIVVNPGEEDGAYTASFLTESSSPHGDTFDFDVKGEPTAEKLWAAVERIAEREGIDITDAEMETEDFDVTASGETPAENGEVIVEADDEGDDTDVVGSVHARHARAREAIRNVRPSWVEVFVDERKTYGGGPKSRSGGGYDQSVR